MFFRLLIGIHTEYGKRYQAVITRDEKGAVTSVTQPIIESKNDLASLHGTDKFQRLSDKEAAFLLQELAVAEPGSTNPVPTATVESEVSKAAKQGAVSTLEPLGKDVTDKHPGAKNAGLVIYRKDKNAYLVTMLDGSLITAAGTITKVEVKKLIEQYSE